jgi:hypothetical protein
MIKWKKKEEKFDFFFRFYDPLLNSREKKRGRENETNDKDFTHTHTHTVTNI